MVDMKPADQAAGSRRDFLARVVALAGALATVGCGGAAAVRADTGLWLEPLFGISGGTLTNKVAPTGAPLTGGSETFISFMYPVAAVAAFGAVFIADAGYGRLFRFDRGTNLMAAIPGIRITPGSRLQVGADGTVYLLDAMGGEIRRHSMHGLTLPAMHSRVPTSRYLDFAVENMTGRVFAVDSMYRVVDQIEPLGRVALAALELTVAGPIALDGTTVLVADAQCRCVNEWRNGAFTRRLAEGSMRLPKVLAAEGGEVYLLDGFDRSISRVNAGGLETLLPAQLNLISPEHISVSGGIMYVTDGVSRTVAVFRIRRRHR
jgi:predicted RecA/RadA family phage recombinase